MANYPGSDPTNDSLHTAVNNLSTALDGAIDDAVTTITVLDTTGFPSVGAITIEAERISYTSTNGTQFLGCTRGFGSTANVSHIDTTPVKHTYGAEYHNDVRDEIIASLTDLRDCFKEELADSTAPATAATDMRDRIDQVVTQLKNLSGEADWKTAPATTLASADTEIENIKKNVRNILTNANFNVWQRGTSIVNPVPGEYTADSWWIDYGGGGSTPTATYSKETGAANVYREPAAMKWDVTTHDTFTSCLLYNTFDNSAQYEGRTVTVSAAVKTSVAGRLLLEISDGSGLTQSSAHTGSGSWELLTATTTIVGASFNVRFRLTGAGTTVAGTHYIGAVTCVEGTTAIDSLGEDPGTELARCQRYYQRIGGISANQTLSLGQCWSTTNADCPIRFPEMRVAPTATVSSQTGFNMFSAVGGQIATTSVTFSGVTVRTAYFGISVASGLVAGNATQLFAGVSAQYVELEA